MSTTPGSRTRFDDAVAELRRFIEADGTASVPRSYVTTDGLRLGVWLHNKRRRHSKGLLTLDQVETLESLGVEWQVLDREAHNAKAVAALNAYRAAHDATPPVAHVTADGFALGAWLQDSRHRARRELERGNPGPADRLAALGIPLWERAHDELWSTGIESLHTYIETFGDTRVPLPWRDENGFPLGRWVNSRRADAVAGRLLPERRKALDECEFEYVVQRSGYSDARRALEDKHFRARLRELATFVQQHGHARLPERYVSDQGTQLGRWVVRQRREHAAGRLAQDRVDQLQQLGFVWNLKARPGNLT